MRVLFISALDHSNESSVGVAAKLEAQARASSLIGHTIFTSRDFGRRTRVVSEENGEVLAGMTHSSRCPRRSKYRFLAEWARVSSIDAVIVRFDHMDGVFSRFARAMKSSGVKVLLELPTYPFTRERNLRHRKLLSESQYVKYLLRKAFVLFERNQIRHAHRFVDYIITYLDQGSIWGCPTITVDNGIDVGSIPVRTSRTKDGSINLLCVAKFAPHHGVDRLIRGIAAYRGGRNVRLILAGKGIESPTLAQLVADLSLESRVEFIGTAVGSRLNDAFNSADIAVGSLGLHRIGISLASTLKAREYCARGIPFVYAFPEKGFTGDEAFSFLLPGNDDPIDLSEVIAFYDNISAVQNLPKTMREYAETHFDWRSQMGRVFSELEGGTPDATGD